MNGYHNDVCVCLSVYSLFLPLYDSKLTTKYKCWYERMTADCTGTPYFLIPCCRLSQKVDRWRRIQNTNFILFQVMLT